MMGMRLSDRFWEDCPGMSMRNSDHAVKVRRPSFALAHRIIAASFAIILVALMIVVSVPSLQSQSAYADDAPGADYNGCPEDNDSDGDARQACGIMNAQGPDGRKIADKGDTYNKAFDPRGGGGFNGYLDDDLANHGILEVWPMMAYRILGPSYYLNSSISTDASQLNQQNSGVHAWKPGRECKSLDSPSSYKNDNCDVPSVVAQGVQDVLYSVLPHGVVGGEKKSGKSPYNIGIPVELIPDGRVPVNRGSNRFTGLEILGYNLAWTSYAGEWDRIDVTGQTRFSSSISVLSGVGKAFQSVSAGISKAAGNASDDVTQAWNEGNLIKIAGSIVSWPFKTLIHGTSNSLYDFAEILLNGYEDNVFQSPGAWNRDSFYTDTAYNVRVMTDQERGQVYLALLQALIEQTTKTVADQYNVDVDDLEKQAAFPSNRPKDPAKGDDGQKPDQESEREAWDDWVSKNSRKLDWGAKTLNVDYKTFAPGASGTASGQVDAFQSAWNKKATEWKSSQMKSRLKANLDSYTNDLASGDISDGAESMKKYAKEKLNDGSLFWVCTNDDGTPQGVSDNDTIKTAMSAGLRNPGASAFDKQGRFRCKDSTGRVGDIRQPISGGLFGQAGSVEQKQRTQDTRRMPGHTMSSIIDPVSSIANFMLSVSQKIAMGINFMVNISFQPILQALGIRQIIVQTITTLRDSFYLNLLVLFIIIGVVVAFVKSFRSGVEGVKSIILVLATAVLGIALLTQPDAIFHIADDYPAYVERMVAALILKTDGSPNSDLCSSTPGPSSMIDASQYKDTNGSQIGFDPNGSIRRAECNVWDAYVFEPWSLGQFGSGYSQLYAKGHAPAGMGAFKEDDATTRLVGDAGVNMGGGAVINNWALYQASLQVAGTSTDDDPSRPLGVIDKNLYRLVDLQAGVNNAEGKDASHWGSWKGTADRFMIASLALASSIGGILSIGIFSITKIASMLIMSLLLALAPIMLLIGTIPGAPRNKMKKWIMNILGQGIKRIIITALLSVQLVMLIVVSDSNGVSPVASMIFTAAMSFIFAIYGRQIIRAFLEPLENAGAGMFAMDDKARSMLRNSKFMVAARNAGTSFSQIGGALVGATIAGGLVGQNTAQARMNRYHDKERQKLDNARNDSINDITKKREHLMDLYRNGTITGDEYRRRQNQLTGDEADVNRKYQLKESHIDDYKDDPMAFAKVLADNKIPTEASEQISRVTSRVERLGQRRQNIAGNVFFTRDAIQATRDEKDRQIDESYRTIFINNPNIAAGVLGLDSVSDAKEVQRLISGVDLRAISDELQLNSAMSADEVITEMESLGYKFRKTADGEFIPVFSPDQIQKARTAVADAAARKDVAAGVPIEGASAHGSTSGVENVFHMSDLTRERLAEVTGTAEKYLPAGTLQNEATHSLTDQPTIDYDLSGTVGVGDSSHTDIEATRDMTDTVDYAASKKVNEIKADQSMTGKEKQQAIAEVKRAARDEKRRRASSQVTAIIQASRNAENEIIKNTDRLRKDGYDIRENPKTGSLSVVSLKTGVFYEDMIGAEKSAADSVDVMQAIADVAPIIDDLSDIQSAIGLASPSDSRAYHHGVGAIDYAMKQAGQKRAHALASNPYKGSDRTTIGSVISGHPGYDPDNDGLTKSSGAARGSGLTSGMTRAQEDEAQERKDRYDNSVERRKHTGGNGQTAYDLDKEDEKARKRRP